ncbi:MAG: aminotransferase class III-fold pyridoxal phosphate-dependent enzyme, partial [Chloroflexota bacterium]|nr:aminotransferase class III-fold pyridoxal phosphate-dependent enzyme [Chloroflexota bacterium]
RDVGDYLAGQLRNLATAQALIKDVRAVGMAIGVQVPDASSATTIVEAMRAEGILIGTTGRHGDTLKIRPPLVFERKHADQLVTTLDSVMGTVDQ